VTSADFQASDCSAYNVCTTTVAVTELPVDAKLARGTGGIETIDGYHVARWSDANLAYVAVSDMDEKALGDFVEAFRRGGGPATEPTKP
jgi:anti-sigma factor RsiW